jgi:hypothetical protein
VTWNTGFQIPVRMLMVFQNCNALPLISPRLFPWAHLSQTTSPSPTPLYPCPMPLYCLPTTRRTPSLPFLPTPYSIFQIKCASTVTHPWVAPMQSWPFCPQERQCRAQTSSVITTALCDESGAPLTGTQCPCSLGDIIQPLHASVSSSV